MSFPQINCALRTDSSFRNRVDKKHHKEYSPLEELDIDMVASFPTSDPLHLIDLGVTKRCLTRWIYGMKRYERKWSKNTTAKVSSMLIKINTEMPSDMHRAVRSLDSIKYWKGVEFRTFLLYVGIVVLKDTLCQTEYIHFLTYFCAVTICSCNVYKKFIPMAKQMFNAYVENYILIYGRDSIGSNVHNLTHITDDMERQKVGNIMDISTYKYENSLRLMGLNIKHCNLPLEQIARRIIESSKIQQNKQCEPDRQQVFKPNVHGPFEFSDARMPWQAYNKIEVKPGISLNNKKYGDQWILTKTEDIIRVKFIIEKQNNFYICGSKIKQKGPFFETPLTSTKLHIYLSDGECSDEVSFHNINMIIAKLTCLKYNDNLVFIPILHTMEMFMN